MLVDGEVTLATGAGVDLSPASTHHLVRVLRLGRGAAVALFDGRGGEYHGELVATSPLARVRIDRFDPVDRESPLAVTLVQAMIAAEKLDWVVEKATELGVARILVVPAARSVVRLDGERLRRREARWREIAVAACCQCGRNRVPTVAAIGDLAAALAQCANVPARAVLDPEADRPLLAGSFAGELALLVGPEGGWTPEELRAARAAGWAAATLGPRTLRTETAGVAAIASAQALAGDLAGPGSARG